MRILICGSRNWNDTDKIKDYIHSLPLDSVIITGGCSGADTIAHNLATKRKMKTEVYYADWEKYGKKAGPLRNYEMLNSGVDKVVAFHLDLSESKGTKHMVEISQRKGVEIQIIS